MDLNETMHAMPVSTINHENIVLNSVTISALMETRGAVKPIESEDVSKYTVIRKFSGRNFRKFSGGIFRKFPDSQP